MDINFIFKVLFSVPSYAIETGYIGLISYSVGCGFTIILPVIFGPLIIEQTKDTAISMNDYVHKRWGFFKNSNN